MAGELDADPRGSWPRGLSAEEINKYLGLDSGFIEERAGQEMANGRIDLRLDSEKGRRARETGRALGLDIGAPSDTLYKELKARGYYWRPADNKWIWPNLQRVTIGYLAFHGDGVYTPHKPGQDVSPAAGYIEIMGLLHAIQNISVTRTPRGAPLYLIQSDGNLYRRRWADVAYIQAAPLGEEIEGPQISDLYPFCLQKRIGANYAPR